MIIYALTMVAIAFVMISIFDLIRFQPTKYWLASKFKIYKFIKKYEDISKIDIREAEALLQFLIMNRCSEENRVVIEIRNGLMLKYYPEGVNRNKRWVGGDYVEIYHKSCKSILRVCFDENMVPKFQIERPQENRYLEIMFFRSKQGNMNDFSKYAYTSDGRLKILENYRDYIIRRVL